MTPASLALCLPLEYSEDRNRFITPLLDLPGVVHLTMDPAGQGRFDIITAAPTQVWRYQDGQFEHPDGLLEELSGDKLTARLATLENQCRGIIAGYHSAYPGHLPFIGGLAGFLSYDLGRTWVTLPNSSKKDISTPDLYLGLFCFSICVDHSLKQAWLNFLPNCPDELRDQLQQLLNTRQNNRQNFLLINKLNCDINVGYYVGSVTKIKGYIASGDCYQVNFARRFRGSYSGHPWIAYNELHNCMKPSFGGFLAFKSTNLAEESYILSLSPEQFVSLDQQGNVTTKPIKGTAPRGKTPSEDEENSRLLVASEKNRAENLMIVDLLRNDLGKCCEPGSINVVKLFELQRLANVHHLVSTISGKLTKNQGAFDLLQAVFPGGSITGAPKKRAMEIIEELEPTRRSIYCGSLYYLDARGSMNSNIMIRTLLCHQGTIYCWGGGGIVQDSGPLSEYEESTNKISMIINKLEDFLN